MAARAARLAQSVEHWTFNPRVVGSSPPSGGLVHIFLLLVSHLSFTGRPHTVPHTQTRRGCSSNGRVLASHVRGTGIDTPHLQCIRLMSTYFSLFSFPQTLPPWTVGDQARLRSRDGRRRGRSGLKWKPVIGRAAPRG